MNHRTTTRVFSQYFQYYVNCFGGRSISRICSVTSYKTKPLHHFTRNVKCSLNYARLHHIRKGFVSCAFTSQRHLSNFRDDDMVKSWLKDVRDDFEKEAKNVRKKTGLPLDEAFQIPESKDLSSATSVAAKDDADDKDIADKHPLEGINFEEIHGFTADELIKVLYQLDSEHPSSGAKQSNINANEEDVDVDLVSDDSDSDAEITSKHKVSSGDKEKTQQDKTHADSQSLDEKNSATLLKTDWSVVEIEDFVNLTKEEEEEEEEEWKLPVDTKRGKMGVFDLSDLVTVLRARNAVDIAVIKIPPQIEYAQHMVLASAKSLRHLSALAMEVNKIYKLKKNRQDKFLKMEGERTDWVAMDIGNIVLHLFMPKVRELYDLETLWTVGDEFDPQCRTEEDPYVFTADELPWLDELEEHTDVNVDIKQKQK